MKQSETQNWREVGRESNFRGHGTLAVTIPLHFIYLASKTAAAGNVHPLRQRLAVEPLFQLHNVLMERERGRQTENRDRERKPVVKVSNKTKRCCAPGCDRRLWLCLWSGATAARPCICQPVCLSSSFTFDWYDLKLHLRTQADTYMTERFFFMKLLAIIKFGFALLVKLKRCKLMQYL